MTDERIFKAEYKKQARKLIETYLEQEKKELANDKA